MKMKMELEAGISAKCNFEYDHDLGTCSLEEVYLDDSNLNIVSIIDSRLINYLEMRYIEHNQFD